MKTKSSKKPFAFFKKRTFFPSLHPQYLKGTFLSQHQPSHCNFSCQLTSRFEIKKMMEEKKKSYLQPGSCHLGFNQYFGKGPSFTDTDCHSSPLRSIIRPETLMCCQQMTPLDLPVLLLHQCQNKSLYQPSSLGGTSFKGQSLIFWQVPVVSKSRSVGNGKTCPHGGTVPLHHRVLCPCHIPLYLCALASLCLSIPKSLCPCPTTRLGLRGSRRS